MLLDPSENDVIMGERRRDKEILLRRHDCVSNASYHVSFRSCYCEKLNLTQSQCHKQHGPLGNRKYLHFQQKKGLFDFTSRLQCCPLTKFNGSHRSKRQSSSNEGNYLALVRALSSSQSCFFQQRIFTSLIHLSSVVSSSSSSPLILQWVFLLSVEAKDVLPSKAQTK